MPLGHLRRGDVIFTADASHTIMHAAIATAQRVGSPFGAGHANAVHPAIATGRGFEVVESAGSGTRVQQLHAGNYRVFCYHGPSEHEIREAAADVAESFVAQKAFTPNYGAYNRRKAFLSAFRPGGGGHSQVGAATQQFGQGAHAHNTVFCSNLVWRCFAAAAELVGIPQLPIANSHSQMSPRDLEGAIINDPHWHARNGGHSMSHP